MTRPVKAGAALLGIVGLLALVAMAARGSHPGTSGHVATRPVPNSLQDGVVTLLALFYVAAIVAIIVLFFHRRPWHEPQDSRWLRNFLMVILLAAIAMAFGTYAVKHRQSGKSERAEGATGQPTSGTSGTHVRRVPTREAHFQWPLALGVAGLVLLGGVWMYVRRRREFVPRDERTLEDDMVATIEATIDDLRRERDARKAVIAAYAHMERTLKAHDLPRRPAETPLEYLARILRGLDVRETAVRMLTELFEYAKFSHHDIGPEMKSDAIDALLAIRDDLQREQAVAA